MGSLAIESGEPSGAPVLVDVQVHEEGEWTVVAVVGELDLAAAPRIRHVITDILGPSRPRAIEPRVVLDLGAVHFIDSSGLGIVFGVLRRVRVAGGTLRVVIVEDQVLDLFALLGLDAVVDLCPSVAAATAAPIPARAATGADPVRHG